MESELRMDGFVVCKKINGWFKPERVFLNESKAVKWGNEKEFGVIGIPEFKVIKIPIVDDLEDFKVSKDTGTLKGILVEKEENDTIPVKIFASEEDAYDFIYKENNTALDVSRISIVVN